MAAFLLTSYNVYNTDTLPRIDQHTYKSTFPNSYELKDERVDL